MRKVYHGASQEVSSPLVHVGRENLDFGKGFYVTDIRNQAKIWAEVKSRYLMDAKGYINEYLFDFDNAIKDFRYKKFEKYDREWLHFIVDSRDGLKVWKGFDIIEGGVANDRVIDTVEAFKAGQISEEKALIELSKHQPNNQICILKQEVVDKYLIFRKSIIV
ncbi:MAG: DUF3990 domain-containing protein [Prevotella sp.]|nr:DUF3990 domain-containing protein [Prevotella sp.]MBQ2360285.1 DUF3990 domain-containing protein [Prevotella sp.]MBQ4028015.1 DUF3990 domain-containing protein [Prevotella sp.]MBQ4174862.1 DUF3990 domain-containing protein [Prevotella sp.]